MTAINIDTTGRGYAAMWESGGGMTSGGSATVIAGKEGEPLRPVFIRRGGHLSCGSHALIIVHEGFHIVHAGVLRGTPSSASISRIVSVSVNDIGGGKWAAKAEVEEVNTYSRGEWDKPLDEKFVPAVDAAFRKAGTYHCRSPFFVDNSSPNPEFLESEKKRLAENLKRSLEEKASLQALSKAAKEAGLGVRVDAANIRLAAIGLKIQSQSEFTFGSRLFLDYYTESSVGRLEGHVLVLEEEKKEGDVRRNWVLLFGESKARREALGIPIQFGTNRVHLNGEIFGYEYSVEGLTRFESALKLIEYEKAFGPL